MAHLITTVAFRGASETPPEGDAGGRRAACESVRGFLWAQLDASREAARAASEELEVLSDQARQLRSALAAGEDGREVASESLVVNRLLLRRKAERERREADGVEVSVNGKPVFIGKEDVLFEIRVRNRSGHRMDRMRIWPRLCRGKVPFRLTSEDKEGGLGTGKETVFHVAVRREDLLLKVASATAAFFSASLSFVLVSASGLRRTSFRGDTCRISVGAEELLEGGASGGVSARAGAAGALAQLAAERVRLKFGGSPLQLRRALNMDRCAGDGEFCFGFDGRVPLTLEGSAVTLYGATAAPLAAAAAALKGRLTGAVTVAAADGDDEGGEVTGGGSRPLSVPEMRSALASELVALAAAADDPQAARPASAAVAAVAPVVQDEDSNSRSVQDDFRTKRLFLLRGIYVEAGDYAVKGGVWRRVAEAEDETDVGFMCAAAI